MAENYQLGDDIDRDVENVRLEDGTRLTNKRAEQIAEDVPQRRPWPPLPRRGCSDLAASVFPDP